MNKNTKNVLIIGGSLLIAGGGFIAFKSIQKRAKEKAAVKALVKGSNTQLGINIPDIAKQLGIDMGYAYPAYDPRRWTENDLAVRILVMKVPKPYIPSLIKEYERFYPGRNLETDLRTTNDAYEDFKYLFV